MKNYKGQPETAREEMRRQVALFRYGVIAELLQTDVSSKDRAEMIRKKLDRSYVVPGKKEPMRLSETTIREWIRSYKEDNLEGLTPKVRCDWGRTRALPAELVDLLCVLKQEDPSRSVELCLRILREAGRVPAGVHLAASTVHRLFARRGLMERVSREGGKTDRRRFAYAEAGQLWMSDVMHGPVLSDEKGRKRKSYLIALIDDATRLVPFCELRFSEGVEDFLSVFREALLRRGIPARVFVDNGAAYRSLRLSEVCARLGTTLIHATAYSPSSKGKIERWFRNCRSSFLSQVNLSEIQGIEELNMVLWTWVETVYHRSPHGGLAGATPLDRWIATSQGMRYPDPQWDLEDLFRARAIRRVYRDRTVSLLGKVFEVDAALVGERVEIHYRPERLERVWIYRGKEFIGEARPVDAYANCFVRRQRPSRELLPSKPPESQVRSGLSYAALLLRKAREESKPCGSDSLA